MDLLSSNSVMLGKSFISPAFTSTEGILIRVRASVFVLCLPFLYLMSWSNSSSLSRQRTSREEGSFNEISHSSDLWSVKMIIFLPKIYDLKYFVA